MKRWVPRNDSRMVLHVSVPRWSTRSAKHMTRWPSADRLVAFLALAASDGSVLETGEDRSALAAASSVSWNSSGARASRRCHST